MGASHVAAGLLGSVGCFALWLGCLAYLDTACAAANDGPNVGLWIYTPYVEPGGVAKAKIFLRGGDSISVEDPIATLDGSPVVVTKTDEKVIRPSRRSEAAKANIELDVAIPSGLSAGTHRLSVRTKGRCSGGSPAWLVLGPVAVFRRRGPERFPAIVASLRFVGEPSLEPADNAGYRSPGVRSAPAVVTLDEIGAIAQKTVHVRFRRRGNRLVSRLFAHSKIALIAKASDNVVPGGLELRAPRHLVTLIVAASAKAFGDVEVVIDDVTTQVPQQTS